MAYDLSEIIGNSSLCEVLRREIDEGRTSHAYIFHGPKGTGKRAIAQGFARALLCRSPVGGHACGNCPDCVKTAASSHPDLRVVEGEGKSGGVKISSVRELRGDIYIRPNESEKKVYIIEDAETMLAPPQNALLKILEEPPPYAVIMLLADRLEAMLPTLRSRACCLAVLPLKRTELLEALKQRYPGRDGKELKTAAELSEGNPGAAQQLLEDGGFLKNLIFAEEIAQLCAGAASARGSEQKAMFYKLLCLEAKINRTSETIVNVAKLLSLIMRDAALLLSGTEADCKTGDSAKRLIQSCPGLTSTMAVVIINLANDLCRLYDYDRSAVSALVFLLDCWEASF